MLWYFCIGLFSVPLTLLNCYSHHLVFSPFVSFHFLAFCMGKILPMSEELISDYLDPPHCTVIHLTASAPLANSCSRLLKVVAAWASEHLTACSTGILRKAGSSYQIFPTYILTSFLIFFFLFLSKGVIQAEFPCRLSPFMERLYGVTAYRWTK